ncbi:MAG: AraC family transcriptional regulator [Tabrizicola sp.]|jgi:AraC-like DNA-binding protein|nr:AraC family transcriptional regulator [Tabrizicola sp.]
MPVFPVPVFISAVLAAFFAIRLIRGGTHPTLLLLIAVCAVQSAIIALVQHYGVAVLRPVQPILALVIPAASWAAFGQAAGTVMRQWAWHAIGPVAGLVCLAVQPALLDLLIPLSFAGYGSAMLLRLAKGEDSLPNSLLDNGAQSLRSWQVLALALIASALCDILLTYGHARGGAQALAWVPSLVSSLSLLALGALSLTPAIESRRDAEPDPQEPSPEDKERDLQILARLDAYVAAQKPHLDPDLTLARLARKLSLPAKQVSAAINRGKGENVSRYINRLRVDEACRLLKGGTSVTLAMLEAGFNTKSNFNREFLRVTGQSPSHWLASEKE